MNSASLVQNTRQAVYDFKKLKSMSFFAIHTAIEKEKSKLALLIDRMKTLDLAMLKVNNLSKQRFGLFKLRFNQAVIDKDLVKMAEYRNKMKAHAPSIAPTINKLHSQLGEAKSKADNVISNVRTLQEGLKGK